MKRGSTLAAMRLHEHLLRELLDLVDQICHRQALILVLPIPVGVDPPFGILASGFLPSQSLAQVPMYLLELLLEPQLLGKLSELERGVLVVEAVDLLGQEIVGYVALGSDLLGQAALLFEG